MLEFWYQSSCLENKTGVLGAHCFVLNLIWCVLTWPKFYIALVHKCSIQGNSNVYAPGTICCWSEVKLHTPLLVYLIAQDTNTFTQINDLCKLLRHDSKIQLQAALKMSLILPWNSVSELTMELFYSIKSQAWFWHLVYWHLSGNGDRYELT